MPNILIMTNCRLGDSLVMVPALKALHSKYADARIVVSSEQAGAGMVSAEDILGNRGLVDGFVPMDVGGNAIQRAFRRMAFFLRMRMMRWDICVILFPPCPPLTMKFVRRLTFYARSCGARRIVAPTEIRHDNMSVVDATLRVLVPLGIEPPAEGHADMGLPQCEAPISVDLPSGQLLAVAPGANMSIKRWNLEAFKEVLRNIPAGVVPVYFGGEADRERCEALNEICPGVVFVGHSIREVAAAMHRCSAYFGNDTGLMHLAVASGLRCVCVFSGRDAHDIWRPYGEGHRIFRREGLKCVGCLAQECPLGTAECMMHNPQEVSTALNAILVLDR